MYLFAIIGAVIVVMLFVGYVASKPPIDDYESDRDWSDDGDD